jgi:hypothetical protein
MKEIANQLVKLYMLLIITIDLIIEMKFRNYIFIFLVMPYKSYLSI